MKKKFISYFRGYDGNSDLHVGITNTKGKKIFVIYEFSPCIMCVLATKLCLIALLSRFAANTEC